MTTPTPEITAEDWARFGRLAYRTVEAMATHGCIEDCPTCVARLRDVRETYDKLAAARREKEQEDGK